MILDENLFENNLHVGRQPGTKLGLYKKKTKIPSSYDLLTDHNFIVYANNDGKSDYYIKSNNIEKTNKITSILKTNNIPYTEEDKFDRHFIYFNETSNNPLNNKTDEMTMEAIKTKKGMRRLKSLTEDTSRVDLESKLNKLKSYPTYNGSYTRPCKINNLGLTPEQEDKFYNFLESGELNNFWLENDELSENIYQEGRSGEHLILDNSILNPKDFKFSEDIDELIDNELDINYYANGDYSYSLEDTEKAIKTIENKINTSYNTLIDFDSRVNQLIENLKISLDGYVDPEDKSLTEELNNKRTFVNGDSKFEIWPDGRFKFYDKGQLNIDSKALLGAENFIDSMVGSNFIEQTEETLEETYKVVDKDNKKVLQGGNFSTKQEAEMFAAQYGEPNLKVVKESIDKTLINNVDINLEVKNIFKSPDKSYPYYMLDRLKSDCEYYLNYGNRADKYLWAGSPEAQIAMMKGIWNNLEEKPEWLTMEQIEDYENKMLNFSNMNESLSDENISHEDIKAAPGEGVESAGATLLNKLIVDEWEAIQGYNDAIVALAAENKLDMVEVLTGIQNEENKHVGELQELMKQLTASAEVIKDGEEEANQELASIEPSTSEIVEDPEEGEHY